MRSQDLTALRAGDMHQAPEEEQVDRLNAVASAYFKAGWIVGACMAACVCGLLVTL